MLFQFQAQLARNMRRVRRILGGATPVLLACLMPAAVQAATLSTGDFGTAGTASSNFLGNAGAVALTVIGAIGGLGFIAAGIGHARNPEHSEILHKIGGIAGVVGLCCGLGAVMLAKGGDMTNHIAAAAGALVR